MAISDSVKTKLNRMNRAAQDAVLGTVVQTLQTEMDAAIAGKTGTHTVTSGEQTAGTLSINTGVTITGFIVQIYRSGKLLTAQAASAATTVLTVATNSTNYVVTTGDVINYIVF